MNNKIIFFYEEEKKMQAIRKIMKAKNKKISILLPENFECESVEIILLPYHKEKKILSRKDSLAAFFQKSPFHNVDLKLERNQDFGREIEL